MLKDLEESACLLRLEGRGRCSGVLSGSLELRIQSSKLFAVKLEWRQKTGDVAAV